MLVLSLVLLLNVGIGYALECMTNCSISGFNFGQPFRIPDGQCQQFTSASSCSVTLDFKYHNQMYTVDFGSIQPSHDFIYIASGSYLSYSILYRCSEGTNCDLTYAQSRINEMVGRAYNAKYIYDQLAPIIDNPSRNGSVQCYNMQNEIVTCSPRQLCSLNYDQEAKNVRSRGCETNDYTRVSVYDGSSFTTYTSLQVACTYNLCNNDTTLGQIKTILANSGLTDSNGRRIAAGTKEMASSFLMTFALISIIVSYF